MSITSSRPKKWVTNKKYLGAFFVDEHFINMLQSTHRKTETPPFFIPARPLRYSSWANAIKQAWDVLRGKADALYWPEDFN